MFRRSGVAVAGLVLVGTVGCSSGGAPQPAPTPTNPTLAWWVSEGRASYEYMESGLNRLLKGLPQARNEGLGSAAFDGTMCQIGAVASDVAATSQVPDAQAFADWVAANNDANGAQADCIGALAINGPQGLDNTPAEITAALADLARLKARIAALGGDVGPLPSSQGN